MYVAPARVKRVTPTVRLSGTSRGRRNVTYHAITFQPAGRVAGVSGLFDFLYGAPALQEQSSQLDQKLADINNQALASGKVDQQTYDQTVAHLAQQVQDTANITGSIDAAAVQGVIEGYQNELSAIQAVPEFAGKLAGDVLTAATKGVSAGVGSIGKGLFGSLPWWVWVGGAVALFIYLGGGSYAVRHARSALSK